MGRNTTVSPLGLYRWDNTIFDLMTIPTELDKDTLIDNLLTETAELEVLYPNPVVFKNLVGVWSHKQLDIWNRLYATTQYEYNPIENYNRYETGSENGTGNTHHSGTDTTADSTTYGGTDGRTEAIMRGGSDTVNRQMAEGGQEGSQTSYQRAEGGQDGETSTHQLAIGGTDGVAVSDTKGHWIAGFNSVASGTNDGLVKQTRDEDASTTTTTYGKTESGNGSKTTTYGRTESGSGNDTTSFGKTVSQADTTSYGGTENITESRTYGQTIQKAGNLTHGETISQSSTGSHTNHMHGNIGVTSTQQMIKEQREVELFNLYDIIIEDFKMRFCILIY